MPTIIGHGVDLVENRRVSELIEKHGERFLARVFTENERAYADSSKKRKMEHYAARFAAKEAVFKALGTGWRNGMAWTDVEVVRQSTGQPTIILTGRAEELAIKMGIKQWHISLSHTATHAIASVIAC